MTRERSFSSLTAVQQWQKVLESRMGEEVGKDSTLFIPVLVD